MPRSFLTGSRIRARRLDLNLRQAHLATACGISASYLNLIEHNRRRIGGKLLNDLARALKVDPSALAQGADDLLLGDLRAAAERVGAAPGEEEPAEEMAGRFPGWAGLIVTQARRVAQLERAVETLSDRLAHDPFLSTSMHDVLSKVTSIRATSAILADDGDVDPEWQARFHRNIYEDSQRLTEALQVLVSYLDAEGNAERAVASPQEECEAWLTRYGYRLDPLAEGDAAAEIEQAPELTSAAGRSLATGIWTRYQSDLARIPADALARAIARHGLDPTALAQEFGTDMACAMRRLAAAGPGAGGDRIGLVICDGSGALTFRKSVAGFVLPRFGATCPLLSLYQALSRPMTPVRSVIEEPGATRQRFLTYAIAQNLQQAAFDLPPIVEATMLVLPADLVALPPVPVVPIGTSCRICPRAGCAARREPSILGEGVGARA